MIRALGGRHGGERAVPLVYHRGAWRKTLGWGLESDAAVTLQRSPIHSRSPGITTETDSGITLVHKKLKVVSFASATNAAQALAVHHAFGYRSAAAALTSGSASVVVGKPSGIVVGDLLLAVISVYTGGLSGTTLSTPSGWVKVKTHGVTNSTQLSALYTRTADGTEPSTWTWTQTGGSTFETGIVICLKNSTLDGTTYDGSHNNDAGATSVAPDISATLTGDLIFRVHQAIATVVTWTGSGTEHFDSNNSAVYSATQAASGATGTHTGTATSTAYLSSWTIPVNYVS